MIAAVVPAAGSSRRMGRPKLVLPVGETTVIGRVVAALGEGGVDRIVVVVPPADRPEMTDVADAATSAGGGRVVVVVPPVAPPDMRASIAWGLGELGLLATPPASLVVTPADGAGLTAAIVARLIDEARQRPNALLVPTYQGRRGHPTVLPWSVACEVAGLPPDVGVNALLARHADRVVEVPMDEPAVVLDLNTPDDYERLTGRQPGP